MQTQVNSKNLRTLPDGRYLIETGLYLLVRGNGASRTYVLRYMLNGKRRDLSLGSIEFKKLSIAKAEALKYREMIARKIDPLNEREKQKGALTFEENKVNKETFDDFYKRIFPIFVQARAYTSNKSVARLSSFYKNDISPVLGQKLVSDISVNDVRELLDKYWFVAPCKASQIRSLLERLFNYAKREGLIRENHAIWRGNLDIFYPPIGRIHTIKHRTALTLDEVKILTETLSANMKKSEYGCILLIALTAARLNEIMLLKWDEIDLKCKYIIIPPERRKDRKAENFIIPMSKQSEFVLRKIGMDRTEGFVFSRSREPQRAIHERTVENNFKRVILSDATIHGMRSTFRDWAAENNVPDIVAEKCLMHAYGNAVFRAYQRSDLLDQRREVMQRWADEILPMEKLEAALKRLEEEKEG